MHKLWSVAALVAAGASSVRADTYPRQVGVSPQHYMFALTLSDATDEIDGKSTVAIRFTKDGLTSFFLDLSTAANGKGMTVTGVTGDGGSESPLRYTHVDNHVNITL